jgi:acyl-CoA thioester hydrolase
MKWRAEHRILYGEVDSMRQAYYGNYLRWFEIGRAEFMRNLAVPYREIEKEGYYMPVTEAYCRYLKPVSYDTMLWIETTLSDLGGASFRFSYEILNSATGELAARGYTQHACLNRDAKVTRVPDFLKKVLIPLVSNKG